MVKSKFTTEKAVLIGAGLLGSYILYKAISNNKFSDDYASGSIGGSDSPESDLLEQQGFDVDPNSAYPVSTSKNTTPTNPTEVLYEDNIIGDQLIEPTNSINTINKNKNADFYSSMTGTTPIYDDSGKIIGYHDFDNQQSVMTIQSATADNTSTGLLGSGISASHFALGSIGMAGSYFTSAGETIVKGHGSSSFLKSTFKSGIESIPLFGEKAVKIVGEKTAETGIKSAFKTGTKAGISLIPFIGTVAGAEFDVAVDKRSRPLAYTANIIGDLLGGAAVAAGSLIGVSETGIGAAALGVGGQIAGEQAVYKTSSAVSKAVKSAVSTVKNTASKVKTTVSSVISPVSSSSSISKSKNIRTSNSKYSNVSTNVFTSSSSAYSSNKVSYAPASSSNKTTSSTAKTTPTANTSSVSKAVSSTSSSIKRTASTVSRSVRKTVSSAMSNANILARKIKNIFKKK